MRSKAFIYLKIKIFVEQSTFTHITVFGKCSTKYRTLKKQINNKTS